MTRETSMPAAKAFELCGGCRAIGYCRFGVTTESLEADGSARFDLACPDHHEGGAGTAHGGWTAAAMEEILGRVVYLQGALSVAKSISIDFLKPVPMQRPLLGSSWVVRRDERKWYLAGELVLASSRAVLARATGISILVDGTAHRERFQRWLQEQGRDP